MRGENQKKSITERRNNFNSVSCNNSSDTNISRYNY